MRRGFLNGLEANYTIGVVGSRRFPDRDLAVSYITQLCEQAAKKYGRVRMVSGGAKGPDTWAEEVGRDIGVDVLVHDAHWRAPCAHAQEHRRERDGYVYYSCQGKARNTLIVRDADVLLAFVMPDRTGGTEDSVKKALAKDIVVFLVFPDGRMERATAISA